jgi:hypothetical protein
MPDPGPGAAPQRYGGAADSPPRRYGDAAELLAGVTERTVLDGAPGKSGARLERVIIGGRRYVLKHLDLSEDWTTRASGSLRGVSLELWERGILARLPGCINQPIVGAAPEQRGPRPGDGRAWPPGCVLLMHDVTPWLVPATDEPIPLAQHQRFLRHMAELHAAFWACGPELDVVPEMHRYLELSPWMAQAEAFMRSATGDSHLVPQLVAQGWPLLAQVAPAAAAVVNPLAHDPGPLVDALAATPHTFVHSNWKLDNLGTDDEGRTVLLDWEQSGVGAPLSDLAWYLAINCRRLPQPKEASITVYREALEDCGIDTGEWWDRQLALCLLGALVQFGWEKALGGYDEELAWWEAKAVQAAPLLR